MNNRGGSKRWSFCVRASNQALDPKKGGVEGPQRAGRNLGRKAIGSGSRKKPCPRHLSLLKPRAPSATNRFSAQQETQPLRSAPPLPKPKQPAEQGKTVSHRLGRERGHFGGSKKFPVGDCTGRRAPTPPSMRQQKVGDHAMTNG